MRRFTLTTATLLYVCLATAQAQTGKLTVTILSNQNNALEGATVELLQGNDSALVKTALSDPSGLVELNIRYGTYLLRSSMTGFKPAYSPTFTLGEAQPTIKLAPMVLLPKAEAQLQGVTVTARKPFIQKLSDRIVVNVDNSVVNAGSTAMDVLERSPGISVDQNDVISLRGKQGVIVMIDGKPSPMSGTDLANYLHGLPSNAIESIHIITSPSAKYDASGNSGIIDIRLKKDQRMGHNGTLTAGYGQGFYPQGQRGCYFQLPK
jgi:iron complex outermembrane receptor protein